MAISDEKYVSFTTFRTNGERKPAPVWIVDRGDGTLGFTTGSGSWKVKRLKNNPACELQACDQRGKVAAGAPTFTGTARIASAAEFTSVKQLVDDKYGIWTKIIPIFSKIASVFGKDDGGVSDTAVIITLDAE